MVESTNSEIEAPDNADVVREMRERIIAISRPAQAQPIEPWPHDPDVTELL